MSVIPVVQGGSVHLSCDNGHTTTLTLASIDNPGAGVGSYAYLALTCPTCGQTSIHPVSGGADQPHVQALFVAVVAVKGCPCGALAAGKAAAIVRSHLRQHAQQLGAGFVA